MTRQDAEAHVRSVGRRCRGPLILGAELDSYRNWLWRAAEDKDENSLSSLKNRLEDIYEREYGLARVDASDFDSLLKRCLVLVFAHADTVNRGICGYDVNDIICANPFDAQKHEAKCPKCGAVQDYIAPWYPGVDGIGEDGPVS